MGLEYQIPMGWKVTAISHGGAWDQRHRKVKWGPFFENLSRTVSLTVTWPAEKLKTDGLTGAVTDGVVRWRRLSDHRRLASMNNWLGPGKSIACCLALGAGLGEIR